MNAPENSKLAPRPKLRRLRRLIRKSGNAIASASSLNDETYLNTTINQARRIGRMLHKYKRALSNNESERAALIRSTTTSLFGDERDAILRILWLSREVRRIVASRISPHMDTFNSILMSPGKTALRSDIPGLHATWTISTALVQQLERALALLDAGHPRALAASTRWMLEASLNTNLLQRADTETVIDFERHIVVQWHFPYGISDDDTDMLSNETKERIDAHRYGLRSGARWRGPFGWAIPILMEVTQERINELQGSHEFKQQLRRVTELRNQLLSGKESPLRISHRTLSELILPEGYLWYHQYSYTSEDIHFSAESLDPVTTIAPIAIFEHEPDEEDIESDRIDISNLLSSASVLLFHLTCLAITSGLNRKSTPRYIFQVEAVQRAIPEAMPGYFYLCDYGTFSPADWTTKDGMRAESSWKCDHCQSTGATRVSLQEKCPLQIQ